MSNVFAKNHKPTGIEFLDLYPQIEILTVQFLKNNVPKSYTNIYSATALQRQTPPIHPTRAACESDARLSMRHLTKSKC